MAPIYNIDAQFDFSLFHNASCAFGVFDGVHLGHQFLISQAIAFSKRSDGAAIALTFDRDPDELFHSNRLRKLNSNEDRLTLLANTGVDAVCVLPFTKEFAAHEPDAFLRETFGFAAPRYLHVGFDLRFGSKASGTVEDLRAWGSSRGSEICAYELQEFDAAPISSTRIRLLLAQGHIEEANKLLGRNYFLRGVVKSGRGEGADMGFRTANLQVCDQLRAIGDGVYAAYAYVGEKRFKAAVNVGVAPMFENATATVEAHLLDFDGDIYDESLKIEFTNWLRPMQKFESVDVLISTVQSNIKWVRENL